MLVVVSESVMMTTKKRSRNHDRVYVHGGPADILHHLLPNRHVHGVYPMGHVLPDLLDLRGVALEDRGDRRMAHHGDRP